MTYEQYLDFEQERYQANQQAGEELFLGGKADGALGYPAQYVDDTITLYVSELTQEALTQAVLDAQVHFEQEEGQYYPADVLKQALIFWLESSIEQLVEDAMFHLFQGDQLYAFNRNGFSHRLHQLQKSPLLEVLPLPPLAA